MYEQLGSHKMVSILATGTDGYPIKTVRLSCQGFNKFQNHAGGVYESAGLWASFWIVDDPATNDLEVICYE
jgi:hypothetical protein